MDGPGLCWAELWRRCACKRCTVGFDICSHCWRGQCYCSAECRSIGRRDQHRKAQEKYSKTPGFREDRRNYQREYREKRKQDAERSDLVEALAQDTAPCFLQTHVTDQSSNHRKTRLIEPKIQFFCNICGRTWIQDG